MKEFDLEKDKAGAPIMTRDGRPARLLGEVKRPDYSIIDAVENIDGFEETYSYTTDGILVITYNTRLDLFMCPTKRVKYANFYFKNESFYDLGEVYDNRDVVIRNILNDT